MSQLRVLVVGASIAGPATAYWLAKAGARVTVIERFPELRTAGQNIDIRGPGVTVMRKMSGMEAAVRSKLAPLEGFGFVRANGQPFGIIRASGNPDQQSILSEYEIFRGDLARILLDMTRNNENVQYIFGEQIASAEQSGQGDGPVTVEFAHGHPTTDYDLVVACDGATSRTRAIALGGGVRDHIHSTNCWAAYFSIKEDLLKGSKLGLGHSAVEGRFYSIEPDPVSGSRVMFMALHPRDGTDATLAFREASKQGEDALKNYITSRYKDIGWKINEVLQGMMETDDFYASELVQVKAPSFSKGRFVLVGDAGYAPGTSGGGTSLALAGAYMLAGEIAKHPRDLAAGLQGYEARMQPLVKDMQKVPPFVPGIMAPQTASLIWLRNSIFAFIAWIRVMEFAQKYLAGAFSGTAAFPLPEYDEYWEK